MTNKTGNMSAIEQGATAVTTHRVRDGHQVEYHDWLSEISPTCRAYPGHLDLQIIYPIAGLTATYTVIIRFDTRENLENWMYSQERTRLIEKVRPHLAVDANFFISSGLDFWFTPEGARAQVPVRWKQLIVTWSAIYPLILLVPPILVSILRHLSIPQVHYIDTLCITGVLVSLMVYLVMPRYTKLVQRWLFN